MTARCTVCGDLFGSDYLPYCMQCANAIIENAEDFDPALIENTVDYLKRVYGLFKEGIKYKTSNSAE